MRYSRVILLTFSRMCSASNCGGKTNFRHASSKHARRSSTCTGARWLSETENQGFLRELYLAVVVAAQVKSLAAKVGKDYNALKGGSGLTAKVMRRRSR